MKRDTRVDWGHALFGEKKNKARKVLIFNTLYIFSFCFFLQPVPKPPPCHVSRFTLFPETLFNTMISSDLRSVRGVGKCEKTGGVTFFAV